MGFCYYAVSACKTSGSDSSFFPPLSFNVDLNTLHEMACIRRYNEPVYIVCTERYTDVY